MVLLLLPSPTVASLDILDLKRRGFFIFMGTVEFRELELRKYLPVYTISTPKLETDKIDGKFDFIMWRRKIKAILVQNKITPTICSPNKYPEFWKGEILAEKLGDAHSCLTIYLNDSVLR
ncbi:hypothetical protein M9H77_29672 [Catharanthus roseus]|uniref:Uncharacterized protein n=1 Tax=Catharanthus roseus TaxID=4058 RepID=A0ACB9ZW48_CATRO|nr:hypothetical protein M9H77_29672 [Catharanthus roseus]